MESTVAVHRKGWGLSFASRTVVEAVAVPETKAAIPLEEIGHLSPATPLPLFGNRWIKSVRVRAQRPPL